MNFNQAQIKAIRHFRGPMMVSAGPGSGKTSVIIHRIRNLITYYNVDPGNILTVTFTKAAAEEMSERFSALNCCQGISPAFGTFHSIFYKILKLSRGNASSLISEKDKLNKLRESVISVYPDNEDPDLLLQDTVNRISRFKNSSFRHPLELTNESPEFQKIYRSYNAMLQEEGLMDFDDILLNTYRLFCSRSDILERWRNYFRFLLIDEFQDINQIQYDIMKLLAFPENNLFVVGDDDQSIYRFRGSFPDSMDHFNKDYPACEKVLLNINYRSTNKIILPSQKLIRHNKGRLSRDMFASVFSDYSSFTVNRYNDQQEEYLSICRMIKDYHSKGIPFSQMAVLLRNSSDIAVIKSFLDNEGIPSQARNIRSTFADSFIARDIIAYLKAASGDADRSDYLRIINRPSRYISRNALEDIIPSESDAGRKARTPHGSETKYNAVHGPEKWCNNMLRYYKGNQKMLQTVRSFFGHLQFLGSISVYAGIEYILKAVGYEKHVEDYCREHSRSFASALEVIVSLKELACQCPSPRLFYSRIEQLRDSNLIKAEQAEDAVPVMTMHSSKGLEFHTVFIPDLNKGIMPSSHCDNTESIYEERRLLYVAMTRAKCNLHISSTLSRHCKRSAASIFLNEIADNKDI